MSELPKEWRIAQHNDVAEINPGLVLNRYSDDLDVSFLPMKTVQEVTGKYDLSQIRKIKEVKKGYTPVIDGDVIFAKITPCMENGKIAVMAGLKNHIGFGSTEFHVSRPHSGVEAKYLFYYFVQSKFREIARRQMTGSAGQLRVPTEYFRSFKLPITATKEQEHIVAKIEELFSDLDNAIENLQKAQEQLRACRQATLKCAFERNSSKVGLDRKNWKEMLVDEIGEVITGNTPSKQESSYYGKVYPLYKPGDLDAGFMTVDSVDGLTEKGIEKARMLPAKSILVTCIGATIGKTGLIRRAGASNQQINAIVPKDFMVSEYVYYFCISPKFQEQIKSNASATTLPILNKTKFQRLMFLVPSRDEQVAIVQEIESHFSLCEKLEETIHVNLQKAESLRQSILKQAFEGKLTEQWRKDHRDLISGENSVEALLKKIKAEKVALQGKSKGKKNHD